MRELEELCKDLDEYENSWSIYGPQADVIRAERRAAGTSIGRHGLGAPGSEGMIGADVEIGRMFGGMRMGGTSIAGLSGGGSIDAGIGGTGGPGGVMSAMGGELGGENPSEAVAEIVTGLSLDDSDEVADTAALAAMIQELFGVRSPPRNSTLA